jgi:TPR repeat protein
MRVAATRGTMLSFFASKQKAAIGGGEISPPIFHTKKESSAMKKSAKTFAGVAFCVFFAGVNSGCSGLTSAAIAEAKRNATAQVKETKAYAYLNLLHEMDKAAKQEAAIASYNRAKKAAKKRDYKEAVRLLRISLKQWPFPETQHTLATMYYDGRGVARDKGEAKRLFRLAAKQEFGPSKENLATLRF